MLKLLSFKFQRIVSNGNFVPEIDGLRFLAIIGVVFFHIHGFLAVKDQHCYKSDYDFGILNSIISSGHLGVPLFFVLSGFILSIPFIRQFSSNANPVDLARYFSRRLTRLEPPYILVMTVLFIASVFVVQNITLKEAFLSYISSLTYTHNILYGYHPILNTVAWSLEIEIQFYLLLPLIINLYKKLGIDTRRFFLILATIVLFVMDHFIFKSSLGFISILNYGHYFFVGILIADLYITKNFKEFKFQNLFSSLAVILLILSEVIEINSPFLKLTLSFIQLISIFFIFYLILLNNAFRFLTNTVITNVGGMCYSIYLLHYPVISFLGNILVKYQFFTSKLLNSLLYGGLLFLSIVVFSSIFYLLIERPCMDRDWLNKLLRNKT